MGLGNRFLEWSGILTPASASSPAPENIVNGRQWGDEIWDAMRAMPAEANSAEAAARTSAVYFCTSVISEGLGSLSVDFVDEGNHRVDLPLAEVIGLEPNPLMTAAEFWAAMGFTATLRGCAFAEPTVGFDNVELWPLDPRATQVEWRDRAFAVDYTNEGKTRRLMPQQLFWFTGLSDATLKPLVPWKQAKGAIDFELALETGARQFFRNNLRFNGVLSTDHKLTDEGIEHIRAGMTKWKQGGIPVLEQGLSFTNTTGTNADAQLSELIRQRTLEMARYWRIPRSMIGEDAGSATAQEQEALAFVKYVMRPWTRRIEQAVTVRLLPPDARAKGVKCKFNLDSLLRGDSATQWRNAVLARTAGILSVNTIGVDWFGQPRIEEEWADDPRAPLNSNRAADTASGGMTSPQDRQDALDDRTFEMGGENA
jgi:HK97 family phage portal protein